MKQGLLILLATIALSVPTFASSNMPYPDQTDVPTLKCTFSQGDSVEYTLDAPKMIWQSKANARIPEQRLYMGEVSTDLVGDKGLKLKLTMKFSDSYFGKSIQYIIEADALADYSFANVVSVKSFSDFNFKMFQLAAVNTDAPFVFALECKNASEK